MAAAEALLPLLRSDSLLGESSVAPGLAEVCARTSPPRPAITSSQRGFRCVALAGSRPAPALPSCPGRCARLSSGFRAGGEIRGSERPDRRALRSWWHGIRAWPLCRERATVLGLSVDVLAAVLTRPDIEEGAGLPQSSADVRRRRRTAHRAGVCRSDVPRPASIPRAGGRPPVSTKLALSPTATATRAFIGAERQMHGL
jgi:hypothetical protein